MLGDGWLSVRRVSQVTNGEYLCGIVGGCFRRWGLGVVTRDAGVEESGGVMEDGMEIYPMAMFPTLSVRDVGASVGWYSEMLGVWVGVCPGGVG